MWNYGYCDKLREFNVCPWNEFGISDVLVFALLGIIWKNASESYLLSVIMQICKCNRGEMEWTLFERSANTYLAPDGGREELPARQRRLSSIFTSRTMLPLARTDYQSGLIWTNITLLHITTTLALELCSFTGCNFFVLEGSLRGCARGDVRSRRRSARN